MTSLIKDTSQFQLTHERLRDILNSVQQTLTGRVSAAYIFGSGALGTISSGSDIDLILVVEHATQPFVQRGFAFMDLFEIYPKLDILVYTQEELDQQLSDSQIGFWKSVRESMKRIV
jgi:predicted nucleotidyltransferase